MGFLDQISRTISQGVDRARFEAEKFQKTTRIQGELSDLKRQVDQKLLELGQRAYDLHRAGQVNVPSIAELAQAVDQLRGTVLAKEEELKQAQGENYIEPKPGSSPPAQSVPISYDTPAQPGAASEQPAAQKVCRNCGFQMPGTAMFCPNCGVRADG